MDATPEERAGCNVTRQQESYRRLLCRKASPERRSSYLSIHLRTAATDTLLLFPAASPPPWDDDGVPLYPAALSILRRDDTTDARGCCGGGTGSSSLYSIGGSTHPPSLLPQLVLARARARRSSENGEPPKVYAAHDSITARSGCLSICSAQSQLLSTWWANSMTG